MATQARCTSDEVVFLGLVLFFNGNNKDTTEIRERMIIASLIVAFLGEMIIFRKDLEQESRGGIYQWIPLRWPLEEFFFSQEQAYFVTSGKSFLFLLLPFVLPIWTMSSLGRKWLLLSICKVPSRILP